MGLTSFSVEQPTGYVFPSSQNGWKEWVDHKFQVSERGSTLMTEFRAGLATFLTLCYILLVNPQLLARLGIPSETIVVSTAISSAVGCFITGYFGNLPFGLAPGLGLSAYLTYGLVLGDGLSIQEAFTACFISGVLLLLCSLTGASQYIMGLIPHSVKISTIVGMGLQIALVGMTSVKFVVPNEETIVGLGDISNPEIGLALAGLMLMGSLYYHNVDGAILIGIATMTVITWGLTGDLPSGFVQFPNLSALNPENFLSFSDMSVMKMLPAIIAFMFIGLIDVSGVVFGMASLAKLVRSDNTVPGSKATFTAVSISTMVSAATGGTPVIVYVESATGIKEGGRTGLTAVIISAFFIASIIFAPLLGSIPVTATAPVAMLIGVIMMQHASDIKWDSMEEAIPAFLTMVTMPFTFSITNGIVLGLISAGVFYVTTGQMFAHFTAWRDGAVPISAGELQRLNGSYDDQRFNAPAETNSSLRASPLISRPEYQYNSC